MYVIWYMAIILFVIFFFKQKTAYEMRISDWSSDVCSSDLQPAQHEQPEHGGPGPAAGAQPGEQVGQLLQRQRIGQRRIAPGQHAAGDYQQQDRKSVV